MKKKMAHSTIARIFQFSFALPQQISNHVNTAQNFHSAKCAYTHRYYLFQILLNLEIGCFESVSVCSSKQNLRYQVTLKAMFTSSDPYT